MIETVKDFLESHAEPEYAAFSSSLLRDDQIHVWGVRLPFLRQLARRLAKTENWRQFWEEDPDGIFEIVLLKGLVLAGADMPDEERWEYVERYVSQITNWSLCDSVCTSLRFVRRQPQVSWDRLAPYWQSDREFFQRFGVVMLLDHYVRPEYQSQILEVLTALHPSGYYAMMAVAWALSVCFMVWPAEVYVILQTAVLEPEVQSMTLRKILESRRVSSEWKEQIRVLRR